MRRGGVVGVAVLTLVLAGPAWAAPRPGTAALQVALQARGLYPGHVDGSKARSRAPGCGASSKRAACAPTQRSTRGHGAPSDGSVNRCSASVSSGSGGSAGTCRRWSSVATSGLRAGRVDGRFDRATAAALRAFQRRHGLVADGIAGRRTFGALAGPPRKAAALGPIHVVRPGESFFSIAQRYHVSPWQLASDNGLTLDRVIVPGQRLRLPAGATTANLPEDKAAVRCARPLVGALRRRGSRARWRGWSLASRTTSCRPWGPSA